MNQGPNLQNFLWKIFMETIPNFGSQYLEILKTKSVFRQISLKVDVIYVKSTKLPIFYV